MSSRNKKYIILIITTALFALLVLFGISFITTTTKITVDLQNTSEIKLYKASSGGNPSDFEPTNKPNLIINKSGEYNIKKGYYIYQSQPVSNEYESITGSFNTNEDKYLTLQPSYSKEKLKSLYDTEISSIKIALDSKYPNQMKNYQLEYGNLYEDGSWFGGYLVPSNGSDNLQVILNKKNGSWEVAAMPNITISKAQYPEIPYKVLESVNVRPF
jgi:hypothetical protein